jgi:hypothetical protein
MITFSKSQSSRRIQSYELRGNFRTKSTDQRCYRASEVPQVAEHLSSTTTTA